MPNKGGLHSIQKLDLKYTYSILALSNCPLSPGNGQLSKHVNKALFYLCVQNENAQYLSKYIIFWLRCISSRRVLVCPFLKNNGTLKGLHLHYFFRNGQILFSPIHNASFF